MLIDYRNTAVMIPVGETARPPGYWQPGKFVATDGCGSFVLPARALESDEAHCATEMKQ
jgi:hypothetical protein